MTITCSECGNVIDLFKKTVEAAVRAFGNKAHPFDGNGGDLGRGVKLHEIL